jgi:hypothetical protein
LTQLTPAQTPFNKSVTSITPIVITKGINCSYPNFHCSLKMASLVNLKPVMIKIAARQAFGIKANKFGKIKH